MAEPAAGLPGVSPLSLLQEQLWLVGELSADQAAAYNTAAVLRRPPTRPGSWRTPKAPVCSTC
jgi:hypothetical protein